MERESRDGRLHRPQRLKPDLFATWSARLKSCPTRCLRSWHVVSSVDPFLSSSFARLDSRRRLSPHESGAGGRM